MQSRTVAQLDSQLIGQQSAADQRLCETLREQARLRALLAAQDKASPAHPAPHRGTQTESEAAPCTLDQGTQTDKAPAEMARPTLESLLFDSPEVSESEVGAGEEGEGEEPVPREATQPTTVPRTWLWGARTGHHVHPPLPLSSRVSPRQSRESHPWPPPHPPAPQR